MTTQHHVVEPRRQRWASWFCALAPWSFACCLFGALTTELDGWFEDAVPYCLAAVAAFALLSPLPWLILRRKAAFRLANRFHALQISLWFMGWIGALGAAILVLWFV